MDKAIFVKKLKDLFASLNEKEKRYAEVWLSELDSGGLYYSEKYDLNVKMNFHLNVIMPEIRAVDELLEKNLDPEMYKLIECATVYNSNEPIYRERGDIILYSDRYLTAA